MRMGCSRCCVPIMYADLQTYDYVALKKFKELGKYSGSMQRVARAIAQLPAQFDLLQHRHNLVECAALLSRVAVLQQPCTTAVLRTSSSCPWSLCTVRAMAGTTHKLSLKKQNNRASWKAVTPYLERQPSTNEVQQQSPVIKTALPPLPVLQEPVMYQRIGMITGPYSVGMQSCFAVIETGGCQWKVTADDVIYHNSIPGVTVNDVLEFNKVLLLGTAEDTTIGRPFVPGASVVAAVEENFKDAKVHVFKKKVRKRYSKLKGHRSRITALRILEVRHPTLQATAQLEESLRAAAGGNAAVSNVEALGLQQSTAVSIMKPKQQQQQGSRRRKRSGRPFTAAEANEQQLPQSKTPADLPHGNGSYKQQSRNKLQVPQRAVESLNQVPRAVVNAFSAGSTAK